MWTRPSKTTGSKATWDLPCAKRVLCEQGPTGHTASIPVVEGVCKLQVCCETFNIKKGHRDPQNLGLMSRFLFVHSKACLGKNAAMQVRFVFNRCFGCKANVGHSFHIWCVWTISQSNRFRRRCLGPTWLFNFHCSQWLLWGHSWITLNSNKQNSKNPLNLVNFDKACRLALQRWKIYEFSGPENWVYKHVAFGLSLFGFGGTHLYYHWVQHLCLTVTLLQASHSLTVNPQRQQQSWNHVYHHRVNCTPW